MVRRQGGDGKGRDVLVCGGAVMFGRWLLVDLACKVADTSLVVRRQRTFARPSKQYL